MKALALFALLAGGGLVSAIAWSVRSEVAAAAEPAPVRHESQAEIIRAAVFACVEAGGTWAQGIEDGVLLGRCYPLPSVGVAKVAKAVRR